jgi:DNA-binding LytR/AlgR family response regulator
MKNLNELEILLIEDNEMHLDILEKKLKGMGANKIVCSSTFKNACTYLKTNTPDIVFSDYYLDEGHMGVDLVNTCLLDKPVPIVFITSFYDADHFHIFEENPLITFLPKNATSAEIEKSIQNLIEKSKHFVKNNKIEDCIYVKHEGIVSKVILSEIEYIAVDGKLLELHAQNDTFLTRSTLSDFYKKLSSNFLKIHQSYVINLNFLVAVNLEESTVKLTNVILPFSRDFKKDLLNVYQIM